MTTRALTWWVYALREDRRYTRFEIARRGGGEPREILAPIKPLKDIQRRLATELSKYYEPPLAVHGYVEAKSIVSNASIHQDQRWVFRADIQNFFPSINFGRVYGLFKAFPFEYPQDVASLLAQICCFENALPQGAPTSPVVSNLICRSLDSQLTRLARSERCFFTRYADDLCFSTNRATFPPNIASVDELGVLKASDALTHAVHSNGFQLNQSKTRRMHRTQRQRVTGLVVNTRPSPDRTYIRGLRNLLYIWRRYGIADARLAFERYEPARNWPPGKPPPAFERVIQGRVQYVGNVRGWLDPVYRALAETLQDVDPTFKPTTLRTLETPHRVRLYVEGETDVLHLTAAKLHFESKGEFTNLILETGTESAAGGGTQLKELCLELADSMQSPPCVCLFDRDDQNVLRQVVRGSTMKYHGNGVIAVVIGSPDWRSEENICVEHLFKDEDIRRTDPDGRRMYLRSEFDDTTGHHRSPPVERVHIVNPRQTRTIPEDVLSLDTGDSVLMSKKSFAEAIAAGKPGFENVDFEGFRSTFENISEAVARFTEASSAT